jgi:predicted CopG family antitoxin
MINLIMYKKRQYTISEETYQKLRKLGFQQKRSMSAIIELAISAAYDTHKNQYKGSSND